MGAHAIKRVATALITDSLGAEPSAEPGPPEGRSHEASERASPGDSQVFTADHPSGERAGESSYSASMAGNLSGRSPEWPGLNRRL